MSKKNMGKTMEKNIKDIAKQYFSDDTQKNANVDLNRKMKETAHQEDRENMALLNEKRKKKVIPNVEEFEMESYFRFKYSEYRYIGFADQKSKLAIYTRYKFYHDV